MINTKHIRDISKDHIRFLFRLTLLEIISMIQIVLSRINVDTSSSVSAYPRHRSCGHGQAYLSVLLLFCLSLFWLDSAFSFWWITPYARNSCLEATIFVSGKLIGLDVSALIYVWYFRMTFIVDLLWYLPLSVRRTITTRQYKWYKSYSHASFPQASDGQSIVTGSTLYQPTYKYWQPLCYFKMMIIICSLGIKWLYGKWINIGCKNYLRQVRTRTLSSWLITKNAQLSVTLVASIELTNALRFMNNEFARRTAGEWRPLRVNASTR